MDSPASEAAYQPQQHNNSTNNNESPTQRRFRAPTKCIVCKRFCQHFNYGVPSCQGCKHFFRRAVLLANDFVCSRDSRCSIGNGIKCKSCRLDRCLVGGMDFHQIRKGIGEIEKDTHQWIENRRSKLMADKEMSVADDMTLLKELTSSNCSDTQLLQYFVHVEKCARKIRFSATPVHEWHYQIGCSSLPSLVSRCENLLSEYDNFSAETSKPVPPHIVDWICKNGTFAHRPPSLALDLLLVVEIAKTMPFFQRLEMPDKIRLVSSIAMPILNLSNAFYSFKLNSKTVIMPSGIVPVQLYLFGREDSKYGNDKIACSLSTKVFTNLLEPFHRVQLSDEEFVLIRAIIYSHMVTTGLSDQAQKLLMAEAQKYSSMLLRIQQARHGPMAGAAKYAEAMLLVEFCFNSAQHHLQLMNYIAHLKERDRFHAVMPPALALLCTRGNSQLPELAAMNN